MAIKDFYESFVISPLNGGGFQVTATKIVPAVGDTPAGVEIINFGFTDFDDLAAWFSVIKNESGS